MAKVYRTAKGQTLDIGSLLLQNENTRAVGNMGVNARGDKINSENQIIKSRNEQMASQYSKIHKKQNLVKDEPVYKNANEAKAAKPSVKAPSVKNNTIPDTVNVQETVSSTVIEPEAVVTEAVVTEPEPQKVVASGLAGAIAKARSVEQHEEKTARQLQQEQEGVKRI